MCEPSGTPGVGSKLSPNSHATEKVIFSAEEQSSVAVGCGRVMVAAQTSKSVPIVVSAGQLIVGPVLSWIFIN